jgi:hypothetical protein
MTRKHLGVALAGLLSLGNVGCIKKILLDGQIESTRKASAATNTLSDWEVAYRASSAGMAQFEGLHYLAPYNEDGLFLLTKGWAGVAFGFIEDEMEQAEDQYGSDSELAEYHKQRAVAAYTRAVFYGGKLLDMRNPGFAEAQKNIATMKEWLDGFNSPEDAEYLFWMGQAWMSRVNLQKSDPEAVGTLFVGVEIMQRSVALDPLYSSGTGKAVLAAYHARSAMSQEELAISKQLFEEAVKVSENKSLLIRFNFASKYYCAKVDKKMYVKMMKDIVDSPDTDPNQRLQNTIAKRRARRALGAARMERCGF